MDYKFYTTVPNDRWDKIAYKFYGDVYEQRTIIEANPDVPITPVLKENTTLIIPILEDSETEEGLPIWKQ